MTAVWVSLLALVSTSVGGYCAMRLRHRLHLVLGFTAGALLAVVCLDLLPEILQLVAHEGSSGRAALAALACGFVVLHAAQSLLVHRHGAGCAGLHGSRGGTAQAGAMIGHSVFDGIGLGLAFQVSETAGLAVAVAILAHDFCDGLNTAGVMLMHRRSIAATRRVVLINAIAPVAGAASTCFVRVPAQALVLYLGFFAGVLLYIAMVDILPRARARLGVPGMLGLVLLGASFTGLVRQVAG